MKSILVLALLAVLSACTEKGLPDSDVYTLYSSNYPTETGRNGVATFDLGNFKEIQGQICQETADLYQADFEKRKLENNLGADVKMRHWCEKGRYRK